MDRRTGASAIDSISLAPFYSAAPIPYHTLHPLVIRDSSAVRSSSMPKAVWADHLPGGAGLGKGAHMTGRNQSDDPRKAGRDRRKRGSRAGTPFYRHSYQVHIVGVDVASDPDPAPVAGQSGSRYFPNSSPHIGQPLLEVRCPAC